MILKPTSDLALAAGRFTIFLAGSIEMGTATDWQERIAAELSDVDNICLLNPRRDDWDASWKQEKSNAIFNEQVSWELNGLERSDLIVYYFSPETKSPVTLLELGLFARSGKVIVCCPEGFWRKGNVDIVCERFGIQQVDDLEVLVLETRKLIESGSLRIEK